MVQRHVQIITLAFAVLLAASTTSAQTRSMTEDESSAPAAAPSDGSAAEEVDQSADSDESAAEDAPAEEEPATEEADAEEPAEEEPAEESTADEEPTPAAAGIAEEDQVDAETEQRIRELEEQIAEQRDTATSALGAARQATDDAESSQEDAEQAQEDAVEAAKQLRELQCELKELQGDPCVDPADEGTWVGFLDIGGSLALNSTANVPGEARGLSVTGLAKVSGVLDYLRGKHEWRNSLKWDIGATRSASDEVWVKSIDRFVLTSGWYYNVTNWFGTFVEGELKTNFFPLELRQGGDTDFCVGSDDGTGSNGVCEGGATPIETGDSFRATTAFEPVTLDERAGVFFQLFNKTNFQWIARAGLGAQQFFVSDDAYNVSGSGDGFVELNQLDKYGLLGVMADTELRGAVNEGMVQYGATAAILYPFVDTNSDQIDALDISPLQVDLGAFVNFTIKEWLGFRVSGEAYRQPQVTGDKWQTRINALLTFSYTLVGDRDGARDPNATLQYGDLVGADGDVGIDE